MPRAPTTLDSFSAIAEPRRRQMLEQLVGHERPVNDIVLILGWPQPVVSKHLGVLLQVGLVDVRRDGRQRLYRVNSEKLKPVHDWVAAFEKYWDHHLDRIKQRAEEKERAKNSNPVSGKVSKNKE